MKLNYIFHYKKLSEKHSTYIFITNKLQTDMKSIYLGIILIALASCMPKEKKFQPDYRGDIASITVYKYTTKDMFGEIHKDKLDAVYKLEFDENNNLINKKRYSSNGNIVENKYFQYNENNFLVKCITEYPNTKREVREYIYDEELLKEIDVRFTFNHGQDGNISCFKYIYDGKK